MLNKDYPCYISEKEGQFNIVTTGVILKSSPNIKIVSFVTDDKTYFEPGAIILKDNLYAALYVTVNEDRTMHYNDLNPPYDLISKQTIAFKELIKPELRSLIINFKSDNYGSSVVIMNHHKQLIKISLSANKYMKGYIKKLKISDGFRLLSEIINNAEYIQVDYKSDIYDYYRQEYIKLSEKKKFRYECMITNDNKSICFSYVDYNFNKKVEIYDLKSLSKKGEFNVQNVYLVKDIEIENDTLYLLVVKPYKDLNEFEIFIQKRSVNGTIINEYNIELPDSKTGSYKTMLADPYGSTYDMSISGNDILIGYTVTALFNDGKRHQGQNLAIYSKSGQPKYLNYWSQSHCFHNFNCHSNDYLFVGSSDGYPSRSIRVFDINPLNYKENIKSFSIFEYPGKSGENYIYDSKVLTISKNDSANYHGFFTTEYYPDFSKSIYTFKSNYSSPGAAFSKGRNQLFYFKSDGKNTENKQLTFDLKADINATAILTLPNGNTIIHILNLKKNENSIIDIDKEPVKFNTIKSTEADTKKIFLLEEYFMVVSSKGEIIKEKLLYQSKNNLYAFDQYYLSESDEYNSKMLYKNGEVYLIKPIQKTNLFEINKFDIKYFD
jgi:hypothetical protein